MKEHLRNHFSEVGESFEYLRSDVRNLSRYLAELEELIESDRDSLHFRRSEGSW